MLAPYEQQRGMVRCGPFQGWVGRLALFIGVIGALTCFAAGAQAQTIINGNFSSGSTGFSSSYTVVANNGTVFTGPGEYALTTNPSTGFTNPYTSYGDHTSGTGTMLFADGGAPGSNVWDETITVSPSTTYTFTGWVASADALNPAVLGLFVGGTQAGSSFDASSTPGTWFEWTETVTTSPSDASIVLSIQDLNANFNAAGDDFTLDDLSLSPALAPTPEPGSALLFGSGLLSLCIGGLLRRKLFSVNAA